MTYFTKICGTKLNLPKPLTKRRQLDERYIHCFRNMESRIKDELVDEILVDEMNIKSEDTLQI